MRQPMHTRHHTAVIDIVKNQLPAARPHNELFTLVHPRFEQQLPCLSRASRRPGLFRSSRPYRLFESDVESVSPSAIGMLTSWVSRQMLKAGMTRRDRPGYSATGWSSGSVVQEIED